MVLPDITKGDEPDAFNVEERFEENLSFLAISNERHVDRIQRRLLDRDGLYAGLGLAGLQQHGGARHCGCADELTTIQLIYHFFRTANLLCWTSMNAADTRPI